MSEVRAKRTLQAAAVCELKLAGFKSVLSAESDKSDALVAANKNLPLPVLTNYNEL